MAPDATATSQVSCIPLGLTSRFVADRALSSPFGSKNDTVVASEKPAPVIVIVIVVPAATTAGDTPVTTGASAMASGRADTKKFAEPPLVASRLRFDCTPKGAFLGLRVDGKRVSFTENVFYEFRDAKIAEVWSIIDKAAIEAQL